MLDAELSPSNRILDAKKAAEPTNNDHPRAARSPPINGRHGRA
jgi:hypothetical protein